MDATSSERWSAMDMQTSRTRWPLATRSRTPRTLPCRGEDKVRRRRKSLGWKSTRAGSSGSSATPFVKKRGASHGDEQAGRGQRPKGRGEETFAARDQDDGEKDLHETEQGRRPVHGPEEE